MDSVEAWEIKQHGVKQNGKKVCEYETPECTIWIEEGSESESLGEFLWACNNA